MIIFFTSQNGEQFKKVEQVFEKLRYKINLPEFVFRKFVVEADGAEFQKVMQLEKGIAPISTPYFRLYSNGSKQTHRWALDE